MNITSFEPKRSVENKNKLLYLSTSDFSPKHQTSEISIKTSYLMLKHQKWQHCPQSSQ